MTTTTWKVVAALALAAFLAWAIAAQQAAYTACLAAGHATLTCQGGE